MADAEPQVPIHFLIKGPLAAKLLKKMHDDGATASAVVREAVSIYFASK